MSSETSTRAPGVDDDALRALGDACASTARADVGSADGNVDGTPVGAVARPGDVEQVQAVLRVAHERGLAVVPAGRRTKLTWGAAPRSADVLLDLSGLDRVLDHQPGDLIVETQAGATLAGVRETVAQADQRLVLDETVPGGTIGGVLATNASGPERMLVGSARDLLIGITMVRADGTLAKAGGRVVKNVAGYDLGKLLIGSYGTLGVVVEAIFRLHPLPRVQRWVGVEVSDPAEAARVSQAVVHAQVVPAAVEVDLDASGAGRVDVLLGGFEDGVARRAEAVAALLGAGAATADAAPDGWARLPWQAGETGVKLTTTLSGVADVLATARSTGTRVRGSAGVGVLHGVLPAGDEAGALGRLRATCAAHGGSVVVVDAPAAVKRAVEVWGPVPALDLMRRVKDQFDPDHRLAPGRFVGGI